MQSNLEFKSRLETGLAQLNLTATAEQVTKLLDYLALLVKWNKTYNLTSVRDPEEMLVKHLLDSLAILPYVQKTSLVDVGSGAGLPSIPLAIMCPEMTFTSLDSNGKKTRFQFQAKTQLGLDNFTVTQVRAESFELPKQAEQIVSRAFASLKDFVELTQNFAAADTQWLAMKGVYPEDELLDLPQGFTCVQSYKLQVPQLNEQRHLLVLAQTT